MSNVSRDDGRSRTFILYVVSRKQNTIIAIFYKKTIVLVRNLSVAEKDVPSIVVAAYGHEAASGPLV